MNNTLLNTLGLNTSIGEQLTDVEFETLVDLAFYNAKNSRMVKRASTTTESNTSWKLFETNGLGKQLKKIELYGDYENIFRTANEFDFKPVNAVDLNTNENNLGAVRLALASNIDKIKSKLSDINADEVMHIVGETKINQASALERYRAVFRLLESYGSTLIAIYRTKRRNGLGREEDNFTFEFNHKNQKAWRLELPKINPKGYFQQNGEDYFFMLIPANLEDYATGKDDLLELVHPYSYIVNKLIEVYVDFETGLPVMLRGDVFDKRVEFTDRHGRQQNFQKKLNDILSNRKENYWDERTDSPIVWVDKNLSAFAKTMYEENIAIFASYELLTKVGVIKGLDLLTGSTSTPAKRVKVAQGYKIANINNKLLVVPKSDDVTMIESIYTDYKLMYPGTLKTSAKRDNSCTIRSSYSLTKPQSYVKRVTVSSK